MSVPVPTRQILKDTFFLGHPIYRVLTREITKTRTQWPHSPILLRYNATGLTQIHKLRPFPAKLGTQQQSFDYLRLSLVVGIM